jgi:hypothetical protein
MLVGMKLVGRLEKKLLSVTVPWKPFRLLKVTLAVPVEPCLMLCEVGVMVMLNPGREDETTWTGIFAV